jgi:uncharacterized repeat protein (TIGR01451 family)
MGSWSEVSPLPTPRRLAAAAAVGSKIYTFGGCGSPCFEPPLHTETTEETRVEVFDTTTGTWSRLLPDLPAIVFGAAAAAAGGRIYIFGGYLTANLVLEYDPTKPASSAWSSKSPMPTPRFGLAAVTLKDPTTHQELIYVVGGSGPTGALEVYDPASDSWSERSPMPTPRVFLAAAALGGKIYALGGSPDADGRSQTAAVEVYDPGTKLWTPVAPLPVAEQLSAAAADNDNGTLYAFGGFVPGVGVRSATYEYDPTKNTWTAGVSMPVARDEAPAVEVNGLAYVLGGSTNCHCHAIGTTESFKPVIAPPTPCFHLTKTADRTMVAPGESLSYLIRVANCGTVPVAVTTSDEFRETGLVDGHWCRGQGCQPSIAEDLRDTVTVAVGEEKVYTVAGQVPCGPGVLKNKACAAAAGLPQQCQTDVDSVAPPTACLQVSGTAPASVSAGDPILYHWTVENLGPCPAEHVMLCQPFPLGLEFVRSSPSCLPTTSGGPLCCDLGTLGSGAVDVHSRFEVPCSRPAGSIAATATVASDTIDSCLANNSATVKTAVAVVADYSIVKSCPAAARAGQPVDYTLTVKNAGPSCPHATVMDLLPHLSHSTWCSGVPCLPNPPQTGPVGAWTILKKADPPLVFQITGVIDPGFCGALSNTATVAVSTGSDPVSANNASTCTTTVSPSGVTGSCFVTGQFSPGMTVVYTYRLTNLGCQAQSVEFTDTLPADLILLAASSDSGPVTMTSAPPTVTWTGQIPQNATVTVTVQAMIASSAADHEIICNQGTVFFNADGNGHFGTSQLTTGPCCLPVTLPPDVPTLAPAALGALALLLAALAHRRIRGKRRRLDGS